MGARGPAPTPTAILKLRGSRLPDYRPGEPQPQPGTPKAPAHFDAERRKVWRETCKLLDTMRVLTVADGKALERYVVLFLRWRKAEEFIAANGTTFPLKGGGPNTPYVGHLPDGTPIVAFMEYPQVRQAMTLDDALRKLEQQFGLTPAARARLSVASQDKPAGVSAFARQRGAS